MNESPEKDVKRKFMESEDESDSDPDYDAKQKAKANKKEKHFEENEGVEFFFLFWREVKMAKYFIDIVQESPRTVLCIPVKTKKPLSRTSHLPLRQDGARKS